MIVLRLKDRAFQLILVTALLLSVTLLTVVNSNTAHASVRSNTIPSQSLSPTGLEKGGDGCINVYTLSDTYGQDPTHPQYVLELIVSAEYNSKNIFCKMVAQAVLTRTGSDIPPPNYPSGRYNMNVQIHDAFNNNYIIGPDTYVPERGNIPSLKTAPISLLAQCVNADVALYVAAPDNPSVSSGTVCASTNSADLGNNI